MPVNGGVFAQAVAHAQGDGIAFAPTQNRTRNGAIDRHGRTRGARDVHWGFTNVQIEFGTAQHSGLTRAGHRPDRSAPKAQSAQNATGGQALDEGSP
ncbi:hypothetical protein D3C78_1467770 [compost metagenome]